MLRWTKAPLYTPFIEKKTAFYIFKVSFELLQADRAGIRFAANSRIDSRYCLLIVDLFTLKICTYSIRNWSFLAKKHAFFYEDVRKTGEMVKEWEWKHTQNLSKRK